MSPEEKQVRVGTAGHTPTVGCGVAHPASNPAGQLAWIGARSGPGAQRAPIDRTSVVPPGGAGSQGIPHVEWNRDSVERLRCARSFD